MYLLEVMVYLEYMIIGALDGYNTAVVKIVTKLTAYKAFNQSVDFYERHHVNHEEYPMSMAWVFLTATVGLVILWDSYSIPQVCMVAYLFPKVGVEILFYMMMLNEL